MDGISFAIQPGEVVGYIGVNGAGKSTTIKMLTGILAPSSGTIRILGRDPHGERIANARDIGVVFGQRTQLWWDLALVESLNLVAKIYEVPQERYKRLLAQFSEELELADLLNVPIRSMSLGQKMRSELAATLIHEPKVVYLDEPTIGLDAGLVRRGGGGAPLCASLLYPRVAAKWHYTAYRHCPALAGTACLVGRALGAFQAYLPRGSAQSHGARRLKCISRPNA